ncbi:MAG: hypothetical protein GEU91_19040 [Rhizobiales bacterium]|nr:hypothetical protein [Hyphomicrobiales bacterium]
MLQHKSAIRKALQGTAIALITWLVLYLTKEHLGRTAALVLAVVIFLFFALVLWARMRPRARNGANPPSN